MDLVDIPEQISTALKYSLTSKRSFVTSLLAAAFVLGIAYDLVYGFFYLRAFNVKDVHYGAAFWSGLVVFAVVVPAVSGAVRYAQSRRLLRPFAPHELGIAIAPFDVASLDPDTLGTAKKLSALDESMRQYFGSAQRAVDNVHWMDDFTFRFLPPYVRIRSKDEARSLREALGATLIIWGEIQQAAGTPMRMTQRLLGPELDFVLQGQIDLSLSGVMLAYFALSGAGFKLKAAGDRERARKKFVLALEPARELDKRSNSTQSAAILEHSIAELDAESAPAATPTGG